MPDSVYAVIPDRVIEKKAELGSSSVLSGSRATRRMLSNEQPCQTPVRVGDHPGAMDHGEEK